MTNQAILIRHYLQGDAPQQLLVMHEGACHAMSPPLVEVRGVFSADGRGGLIAAATAASGRHGYINGAGDWLVAPELDDAFAFSADGLARYCEQGRWGYLNLHGVVAIAPAFDAAAGFSHGLAAVKVANGLWRYIDTTGAFAVAGEFVQAGPFAANGLAAASLEQQGSVGYIDRVGRWAIAPRFAEAGRFGDQGVAPAAAPGSRLHGLIDATGNWVLEPQHDRIHEFNADGLAYYEESSSNHGYLNAAGEVVIGERSYSLSDTMRSGIAKDGDNSYLGADGIEIDAPGVLWSTHFNEHGFALARGRLKAPYGVLAAPRWGMLHTSGAFLPVPDGVIEPLTMPSGSLVRQEPGTALAAFLGDDGSVAMLDRDARIAYRWRREQGEGGAFAVLADHSGHVLWQSPAGVALRVPAPFFTLPAASFLDPRAAPEQLIALAESLRARTADKLRRLACDPAFDPCEAVDEEDQDLGEEGDYEDDEDDEDAMTASAVCTYHRVYREYLDSYAYGKYEFLDSERVDLLNNMHAALLAQLEAHFGPAVSECGHIGATGPDGESGWAFALADALPGTDTGAPDQNRLWLTIWAHGDSGDGDIWNEIWLTCAPTPDALAAALRARAA